MINDNEYTQFINNILNKRGRYISDDVYKEKHHIIPKCMGGSDDVDNIIELSGQEHFIAHKLLADNNPSNKKLIYAYWRMANQNKFCTPEEYERAKTMFVHKISGENHPLYNEHPTLQTRRKLSEAKLGKHLPNSVRQKISQALKNKPRSIQTKQKISQTKTGTKHSEETKRKLSLKNGKHVIAYDIHGNIVGTYCSTREAERQTGIAHTHISDCCNGKQKIAGGYKWRYQI